MKPLFLVASFWIIRTLRQGNDTCFEENLEPGMLRDVYADVSCTAHQVH